MADHHFPTRGKQGYTAALLSAAFFSASAIFIRYVTLKTGMPALVMAYWREVVVGAVLFTFLFFLRRQWLVGVDRHIFFLMAFGFIIAIHNALWTLSLTINGAAIATALAYVSPAFTVVLSYFILREELTLAKVAAVILCITGSTLLMDLLNPQSWSLNALGIFTGLVTGFLHAVYTLMGRGASLRHINPWATLCVTFGFASFVMLFMILAFGDRLPGSTSNPADLFWLGRDWISWGILIILIGLPTVIGWGSYNVALDHLPGSIANLIITIEPVITAVVAYFFLHEILTGTQVVGSLLILTGVILMRVKANGKV
jgi:drug/metabolite transporter (DMT)-like permease